MSFAMHVQLVFYVIVSILILLAFGHHVPGSGQAYRRDGDILFGGLFPVHETGSSGERCGKVREFETLHRMEAMVFAIEEINRQTDILPDIELGFEIRDTCSDVSSTQVAALKFMPSDYTREGEASQPSTNESSGESGLRPITGVIGTEMSSTTMSAAQLLGINHIPVVSYFATSDDLSDQVLYPYFLRVVPPDRLQVQAMLKIIQTYEWSYFNVVYSDDSYGTNAYQEIVRGAADIGICIAGAYEVGVQTSDGHYDRIIQDMQERPRARVIILFVHVEDANSFLSAMRRNSVVGHYQILGSDGWGMSIGEIDTLNRRAAQGSLKTHLFSAYVRDFEDYFLTLTPQLAAGNPWFEEYINASRNCSVVKYGASCLSSPGFSAGSAVSLVVDAVYTTALGLDEMQRTLCGEGAGLCPEMVPLDSAILYDFMTNVSFFGSSGRITFDEDGDAIGRYIIDNIQLVDGNYELVTVGFWTASNGSLLVLNTSKVVWGPTEDYSANEVPLSYCSDPCAYGEIYIPRENKCCWNCFNCSDDEITVANQTECFECSERSYPDKQKRTCDPVGVLYMTWHDPLAIMLVFFAVVGILFCTLLVFLYVRNRENVLIKASSRELSSIILVGIYLSYLLVFILIIKPSRASCFVTRMFLMLPFTFVYAPLVTRVNRIYRIFTRAQKSARRPSCISPTSQVTIALSLVAVQVVINIVWVILVPPASEELVVVPRQVVLVCNISTGEIISSLTYNFVLIAMCSALAFMTRKVPNNYNESRFIALSVYTVLVIWIGFISTYFAINDSSLRIVVLSLAMICNGSITLCFMFLSKLYAIYFDKDVMVSSTNGASVSGAAAGESTYRNETSEQQVPVGRKVSSISILRGSVRVRPSEESAPKTKRFANDDAKEDDKTPQQLGGSQIQLSRESDHSSTAKSGTSSSES